VDVPAADPAFRAAPEPLRRMPVASGIRAWLDGPHRRSPRLTQAKETAMIMSVLQHTPVWVWILAAVLVRLGTLQARDRTVSPWLTAAVPILFIALSLSGVVRGAGGSGAAAPYAAALSLAAWFAGFVGVWSLGHRRLAVHSARWLDAERRIHVPGSWLPLFLMVGLFAFRYLSAVAAALAPALSRDPRYLVGCNLIFGAFAAVFWIRSRSLRRLVPASDHRADDPVDARADPSIPAENSPAKTA
jgi:hypothetical protein